MTITHKILITETLLSDGSPVYAVGVWTADEDRSGTIFDAIDYRSASQIADDLVATIQKNSLSTVKIIDRSLVGPRAA